MDERQPAGDVYGALAKRLGVDPSRPPPEGPVRAPGAGPSDETALEKLLRLSAQLEQTAAEIRTLRSATYRAQLWQQWAAILCDRPEVREWLRRGGPGGGGP